MTARRAIRLPRDLYSSPRYVHLDANTIALLAWCDFAAGELGRRLDSEESFVWFVDALDRPYTVDAFFIGARCTDPERVGNMLKLLEADGSIARREKDGAYGFPRKGRGVQTERQRKDAERKRRSRAAAKAAQLAFPMPPAADAGADKGCVRTPSAPGTTPESASCPRADAGPCPPVVRTDIEPGAGQSAPILEDRRPDPSAGAERTGDVAPPPHFSSSDQIGSFERSDQKKEVTGARLIELWNDICARRLIDTGQEPQKPELTIRDRLAWHINRDPARKEEGYWRELFERMRDNDWLWRGKHDRQGAIVPVTFQWVLSTFTKGGFTNLEHFILGHYDKMERAKIPKKTPEPEASFFEPSLEERRAKIAELRAAGGPWNLLAASQIEKELDRRSVSGAVA